MNITFAPDLHEYRIGGRRVPSVTQILKGTGFIDTSFYTEAGRNLGTFVHKAIQLSNNGELDESSVSDEIKPFLSGWRDFVRASSFRILSSEIIIGSRAFSYAGMADAIGVMNRDTVKTLVDVKTGAAEPWHCLQTAAYADAAGCPKRGIVYLRPNGLYSWVPHIDPADIQIFKSAANVFNWQRLRGIQKINAND